MPTIIWLRSGKGSHLVRYDGRVGDYPYDCTNRRLNPKAVVFHGSEGDWFASVGGSCCLGWRFPELDDVPFPSPEALAGAMASRR